MAYIDYKEATPGIKTEYAVMDLSASQIDIIRTCLNNAMGELLISRTNPLETGIRFKVMELCDLFNDLRLSRLVPNPGEKLTSDKK